MIFTILWYFMATLFGVVSGYEHLFSFLCPAILVAFPGPALHCLVSKPKCQNMLSRLLLITTLFYYFILHCVVSWTEPLTMHSLLTMLFQQFVCSNVLCVIFIFSHVLLIS